MWRCGRGQQASFAVILDKIGTQEEYIRGNLQHNPYQSTDLGPLMRDIKNKVWRRVSPPPPRRPGVLAC